MAWTPSEGNVFEVEWYGRNRNSKTLDQVVHSAETEKIHFLDGGVIKFKKLGKTRFISGDYYVREVEKE